VDAKYHTTVIETTDGRTIRGLLLSETGSALRLKTTDAAEPVDVPKAQVKSQRKEATTIMPELFDKIGQNEFSEIVAFLQSSGR
jgi:hypothetical protein